jgi:hypothetical protein
VSLLISAENFLRTRNLRRHAGGKTFGMGYRPVSQRTAGAWNALPKFESWLHAKGAMTSSGNDNKTGTMAKVGNIFDQNLVGSCTAESSCKAARISILTRYGALPEEIQDFSQRIMYGQTRQIEAAASVGPTDPVPDISDSGCEPADCITALSNFGLAPMEAPVGGYYSDVWAGNVNREIVLADEEKTLVLPGAHAIDLRDPTAEWQAMIEAGLGGTLALFVDTQNFMAYDGSEPIQKIDLGDPQGGGHQVCGPVAWYTSSSLGLVWTFANSWAASYGINGYGEITHTALMSALDAALVFDISLQSPEVA